MTEDKREEILKFLLAWDAEQTDSSARPDQDADLHDDPDPVVRALSYFPKVSLQ
jgi:hypothetical protein